MLLFFDVYLHDLSYKNTKKNKTLIEYTFQEINIDLIGFFDPQNEQTI